MELYIHIPFCRQKCRYCSFASFTGQEAQYEAYTDLLLKEALLRRAEADGEIETVYIGGGTPSLLPPPLFVKLFRGLRSLLPFGRDIEFTSEANPGTVTVPWLEAAAFCGVNRLSFGMQASQDRLLALLGRIHRFEDTAQAVSMAKETGFSNISLDLIFGIPTQTRGEWTDTLRSALSLNPVHISAYGLIPEEGTPLNEDLGKGLLSLPEPDEERRMYADTSRILGLNGLQQYEISNYAKKGYECRHNIGYWTHVPYLGLGVSAASMTGVAFSVDGMTCLRRTNPDTLAAYCRTVTEGTLPAPEYIDQREARFETMMLGLRMNRGVSGAEFLHRHGVTPEECFGPKLEKLEQDGLLIHENGFWKLSPRGFDIQNSVLVELMD